MDKNSCFLAVDGTGRSLECQGISWQQHWV